MCVNAVGLISNLRKHYVYLIIEIGYKDFRLKNRNYLMKLQSGRGIHTNWLKKGAGPHFVVITWL